MRASKAPDPDLTTRLIGVFLRKSELQLAFGLLYVFKSTAKSFGSAYVGSWAKPVLVATTRNGRGD